MTVVATIADGFQEDYAKSIGRLPRKVFKDLNLEINEIIEVISGDRRVGIFVQPTEEILDQGIPPRDLFSKYREVTPIDDEGIILHINGFIRSSLKVSLGQKVQIDKTSCRDAQKVLIAPLNLEDKEKVFFDYLTNRPIIRGQIIELQNIGYDLKVAILDTSPPGIVRIGADSDVRIASESPSEIVEEAEDVIMYDDIGGNCEILTRLRTLVEYPLRYPELFEMINIHPPQGILITGPPGIGKTYIAKGVASESGVTRFFVQATEIVKGWWTTEKEMEKYFQHVLKYEPTVLIIDQIEVLAPAPSANLSDLERRMTDKLIHSLDQLVRGRKVIIIGTTTDANQIHPALRVFGRFEVELNLPIPNFNDRFEILCIQTRGMPLAGDVDLKAIAKATGGYTPADLELLVKEAGMYALERQNLLEIELKESPTTEIIKTPNIEVNLCNEDFIAALATIKPSASREIIIQIPRVTWSDIGGLEEVQQSLKEMIEWPIRFPEVFAEMGIRAPRGVLLYGPPGTGKTLLAKALANEIQANFLVVKGPELLSKWFAESARQIRTLFRRARQLAPCIIFFDEIDALAGPRGGALSTDGSRERDRVINQLLASLDGIERMRGVFVVGATNRPNAIDPALLRPGRLDRLIYIPVPDLEARIKILKVHTKTMPLAENVDLQKLAEATENFTGADLENLCREAAYAGLRRDFSSRKVTGVDFEYALSVCRPTVTPEVIRFYKIQEGEMKKHRTLEYTRPREFL
ncbi:MAG: AAA family ATPase [Candidatus Heimdallarchaeota archaeon]|nr:MAG: AAA family ATPase [Candidatus Heimdallarchaeota archaeon]